MASPPPPQQLVLSALQAAALVEQQAFRAAALGLSSGLLIQHFGTRGRQWSTPRAPSGAHPVASGALLHHDDRSDGTEAKQPGSAAALTSPWPLHARLGTQSLALRGLILQQQRQLQGPLLMADWATGRRHISYLRFLSGGAQPPSGTPAKKSSVPDAADADAAIADYQALRARLDTLQKPASIRTTSQVVLDAAKAVGRGLSAVWQFLLSVPGRIAAWRAMTPEEWAKWKSETWATVKHEAHHYWVGTKLLGYEVRIASRHAFKAAQGKHLSRRERAQLTRTTADLFRLVPMVIIIVVPFLEFLLPVLLRIFPNMLPSTFEDKLKKEEELKRRLALRLELARFLQDTVAEMASDLARRKGAPGDAKDLDQFIQKVRAGQEVENAEIIRFARLFNDELTLDHLERVQLVSMCQFVGISPFGTDAFLRSRLRQHLQQIKQDDFEIEQEGLENLTEDELRQACRARGMRAPFGEGAQRFMQRQMRDWLDLSLHRGLPSSLLLLSRAFTITATGAPKDIPAAKDEKYEKLKETLGVIPGEVVESLAVEVGAKADSVESLQQRLKFLQREEEAIRAELKREEEAAKAAKAQEEAMRKAVQESHPPVAPATATTTTAVPKVTLGLQPIVLAATPATTAGPAASATPSAAVMAPEEAAAEAAAAKERKMRAIIGSLMDMATGSAVAKERSVFMGLMRNEIERVNKVLAESGKGSSTGTMSFSSKGLEVAKDTSAEEEGGAKRKEHQALPSQLSERVSKMLTSIEAELDAVETKIGKRLHVLDTDADGKVSSEEVEQALKFLRDQLSPQEMVDLLNQLKQAAKAGAEAAAAAGGAAPGTAAAGGRTGGAAGDESHLLPVEELLNLATPKEAGKASTSGGGASSS